MNQKTKNNVDEKQQTTVCFKTDCKDVKQENAGVNDETNFTKAKELKVQGSFRQTSIRRRMSSVRRARVLLRSQSYEGNITKTLMIVVVAFTVAVLPLIICLFVLLRPRIQKTPSLTKNYETTSLIITIILLFINSFTNSVIYGSKMRDFPKTMIKFCQNVLKSAQFCRKVKDQVNHIDNTGNTRNKTKIFRQRSQTFESVDSGLKRENLSERIQKRNTTTSASELPNDNNCTPVTYDCNVQKESNDEALLYDEGSSNVFEAEDSIANHTHT